MTAGTGRSFAPIGTFDEWLRCSYTRAGLDATEGAVVLAAAPAAKPGPPPPPGPEPDPVAPEPAGLAFDPEGCLYHGDLERGQVERVAWHPGDPVGSTTGAADAVDLLAPPRMPIAGDFAPSAPAPGLLVRPSALAVDTDEHLFLLDGQTGAIHVLDLTDGRLLRTIVLTIGAVDLAADGRRILVAAASRERPLVVVDALGEPVAAPDLAAKALRDVDRAAVPTKVAVGPLGQRWLLYRVPAGAADPERAWAVPVADRNRDEPLAIPGATDIELDGQGRLVVGGLPGRVLRRVVLTPSADAVDSDLRARNYDGHGLVRTPDGRIGFWTDRGFRIAVEARPVLEREGHVDCYRLDGGEYQRRWGRVLVEACVPAGASILVGAVTADDDPGDLEPMGPSIPRQPPANVPAGEVPTVPPYPPLVASRQLDAVGELRPLHRRETGSDRPWATTSAVDGFEVYEAPVQAPPGRYLWLRLGLTGTTVVTPRVRAVRVEVPGHDLLRRLPRTYSKDPVAAAFLHRYLAIADGMLVEMEQRSAERDLLFDPYGAPTELLPWLASLVGLTLDGRWPVAARRTMLSEAVCLFRRRGTVAGLRRMLAIYLGCQVIVLEAFRLRGSGGAFAGGPGDEPQSSAGATVGFGLRVGGGVGTPGTDPMSSSPPDAFATHAHRFSVLIPRDLDEEQLDTVDHLLDLHRPAHTAYRVCTVGRGMRVGIGLHVDVSTIVGPSSGFRRAVVGSSRLGTNALLGTRRAGVRTGGAHVGVDTVVDP